MGISLITQPAKLLSSHSDVFTNDTEVYYLS